MNLLMRLFLVTSCSLIHAYGLFGQDILCSSIGQRYEMILDHLVQNDSLQFVTIDPDREITCKDRQRNISCLFNNGDLYKLSTSRTFHDSATAKAFYKSCEGWFRHLNARIVENFESGNSTRCTAIQTGKILEIVLLKQDDNTYKIRVQVRWNKYTPEKEKNKFDTRIDEEIV